MINDLIDYTLDNIYVIAAVVLFAAPTIATIAGHLAA